MKLRPKEQRLIFPKAADVIRPVEQEPIAWFDPARDFDPELKEEILERVRSKSLRFVDDGVEYMATLFPNEFKPLLLSGVEAYIKNSINHPGQDGYYVLWKSVVKAALRVRMAFPEKASSIQIPPPIQKEGVNYTNSDSPREKDDLFRFLRTFVLGVSDNKSWEWHVVTGELKYLDRLDLEVKTRRLAQARLLFPEKDFSSYVTGSLKHQILQRLSELSELEWSKYAELAWAATILAAKEVGISPSGEIFYSMPGKKLSGVEPQLPERPTM